MAMLVAGFIVREGFDLGGGVVQILVAHSDTDRRELLESSGPSCAGNLMWALAAAAALGFALSGISLPLAIVLWLLIVHAVSLYLRSHADSRSRRIWAALFAVLSLIPALLCGASVSQLVRGRMQWDWYTCLVAAVTLLALTLHGALWIALKSTPPLRARAAQLAHRAWWAVVAVTVAGAAATLAIQPGLAGRFAAAPWGYAFPVIAIAGLLGIDICKTPQAEALAYLSSCGFLTGLAFTVAFCFGSFSLPPFHTTAAAWLPAMALAIFWGLSLRRTRTSRVRSGRYLTD